MKIIPGGQTLGARIEGIDLGASVGQRFSIVAAGFGATAR